jgi:hypothetical protein
MCLVPESNARKPPLVLADLTCSPVGFVKYATMRFPLGTGLVYHHPCETASIKVPEWRERLDSVRLVVIMNAICRSTWIRLTPKRDVNQLCLPLQSTIHSALTVFGSGTSTKIAQPSQGSLRMRGEPENVHSRDPFATASERNMVSKAERSKCQPCPLGSDMKFVLAR